MNGWRVAWLVLVAVGFLGATAFVALYATGTRDWHATTTGRILMGLAAVLGGLLGLSLLRLLVPVHPLVWLGGMVSLDVVLWAMVALLWRLQRGGRRGG